MNEVNPLSFIRRVIPDTAAATNAETFKQKAALGLQENKQAAAMRQALAKITADRLNNMRNNNLGSTLTDDQQAPILQERSDTDIFKNRMTGLASGRDAGIQSSAPQNSSLANIVKPVKGFNQVDLKGVSMAKAQGAIEAEKSEQEEIKDVIGPDGNLLGITRQRKSIKGNKLKGTQKNTPLSKQASKQIIDQVTKQFGVAPDNVFLDGKGGFIVSVGGQNYPGTF